MASALDPTCIKPSRFNPWPLGHYVVFLGKTLYSYGASRHPGGGTCELNAGGIIAGGGGGGKEGILLFASYF